MEFENLNEVFEKEFGRRIGVNRKKEKNLKIIKLTREEAKKGCRKTVEISEACKVRVKIPKRTKENDILEVEDEFVKNNFVLKVHVFGNKVEEDPYEEDF